MPYFFPVTAFSEYLVMIIKYSTNRSAWLVLLIPIASILCGNTFAIFYTAIIMWVLFFDFFADHYCYLFDVNISFVAG